MQRISAYIIQMGSVVEKQNQYQMYQVIIIGAGVSGIGASRTLSKQGVPHIILESRDRFGGRITSTTFAGVNVQLGANYIHMPKKENNLITKFVNQNEIQTILALVDSEVYYYEGQGILKDKFVDRAQKVFDQAEQSIQKITQKSNKDISILQAFKDFQEDDLKEQDQHVQDAVFWRLNLEANDQGCELSDLSAKMKIQQENTSVEQLIPVKGYSYVFKKLLQSCKGQFSYNTKVVSVDMTGDLIVLKTLDNRIFKAKKVISSIPLGILQKKLVIFNPPLPEPYQKAIQSIGNGIVNKLFCSFKKPFWGNRKGWMNFVMRDQKVSKFPLAFIVSDPKNHILAFEVGITACLQLGQMTQQQLYKELDNFLSLFIKKDQYQLDQVMMTSWHLDQHTLGSYAYYKVGTNKQHFNQLRKPIQKRFWFIGEHTNAETFAFVQGALQTGIWAAQQVIEQLEE